METIFLFLVILSGLVLAHEGGHFIAAKLSGVRVDEFALGFPPRLFAVRRGQTDYSVNLLPLGGFVRIAGEDGRANSVSAGGSGRLFHELPFVSKLTILFAGVAVNWIAAVFLFGALQVAGAPIAITDEESVSNANVVVTSVATQSPAETAGLRLGDRIVSLKALDGTTFTPSIISGVQEFVRSNAGKEVVVTLQRNQEERSHTLVPRENPPEGQGALGVSLQRVVSVSYPWHEAIWRGAFVSFSLSIEMLRALGGIVHDMVSGNRIAADVAGPVGIAALTGDAASLGFFALVNFVAILSLNLAILNAVPFPALDGGRVAVAIVESAIHRSLPARGMAWFHALGFAILLLLLFVLTVHDVRNFL